MQPKEIIHSIGLLVLRLAMGGYMMTHGWGKLQMVINGQADQFGDPIGLGSALSLYLVTFAEFFCALAIVLGLATRLAAIPLIFAMGVAAFVAHGADPWTMSEAATRFFAGESESWASKEPALMFLAGFLALALTGPGLLSIDTGVVRLWKSRNVDAPPSS